MAETTPDENNPDKPPFKDKGRIGELKEQMYSRERQPAKRPRRGLSALEKVTPDDWQTPKEQPKKGSIFPQSYSFASVFLVAAILFFVIAAGFAISYILSGGNVVSSSKIDIEVRGSRTVDGGEILELQVAIRNNNTAALELADLVVTYPPGTRMPANLSTPMETQRIPLGFIEPGGTRSGTVRAVLFGKSGERQDINVALEYRLEGSSAIFFAESSHDVLVSGGTLEVSVVANDEVVAGQQTDLTVTVTSNAQTKVSNAILRATYPFGFSVERIQPETQEEGVWRLGDIEPGGSRVIHISGKLDGQTGDERIFRFLAGTPDKLEDSTVDVLLADFEHSINVTRPFLSMTLSYEQLPARSYIARTGDTIPIQLQWQNTLDVALSDVVVAATLSGAGLDPFAISADRGFFRSIDSVVLWDKSTTKGELATVTAGQQGALLLRITPRLSEDLLDVLDPTIKIELHAAAQRLAEGEVPETIQATVTEEVKLATDIGYEGKALYFENPLGSVGPLPPKIEHETTYGILWEVTNTTSLVREAQVTATLPPYVRWLGVVSPSVEHVTFNENDGTVTWHLGKLLPQTGGGDRTPRRVVFNIGLVPSTSQLGETPPIVQSIKLSGIDNFTSVPLELEGEDLNTLLSEPDFADVYARIVE